MHKESHPKSTSSRTIRRAILAGFITAFGVVLLWSFCTFWTFANKHPAIFLVVIGVVGETVFDWNKKKEVKERLKKFFAFMLIVGLVWEIPEASENDKKAA